MGGTDTLSKQLGMLKKLKARMKALPNEVGAAQGGCMAVSQSLHLKATEFSNAVKHLEKELSDARLMAQMYETQVMQLRALEKAKAAEMKKGGDEKSLAKIEKTIQQMDKACSASHAEAESAWGRTGALVDSLKKAISKVR